MREILFRGKDTDGRWQYGDYIRYNEEFCNIKDTTIYRHSHLCRTSTIGQYTGLTDKNGTKIFEGDVVVVTDAYGNKVTYIVEYKLTAFWVSQSGVNYSTCLGVFDSGKYEIEIIGNIHDNPELLKNG